MKQQLYSLIKESYDKVAAEATISFSPKDFAVQQLVDAGKEVLTHFPNIPGACSFMSAIWTALIRDNTEYPIHAVAGSLFMDGVRVFGSDLTANQTKGTFRGTNFDWDGHCWIMFGNLIGDISLFRTAYSDASPPGLKQKIISEFGMGRGLFISPYNAPASPGIIYAPQYVLTDDEISGLIKGAQTIIEGQANA